VTWELSEHDMRQCMNEARAEVGLPPLPLSADRWPVFPQLPETYFRTGRARYVDTGEVRPAAPLRCLLCETEVAGHDDAAAHSRKHLAEGA